MPRRPHTWTELLPDLFLHEDTCNVYVLRSGDEAIAVDFGSGRWLADLHRIGVKTIRRVLLTHAHRDQCGGLAGHGSWPFEIHAPAGSERFFRPEPLAEFWKAYQGLGCPANYSAPRVPLPFVVPDLAEVADIEWQGARFRFLPTPGHTANAVTCLVDWSGAAIAFCGDAVRAGGTIHQPYHLEWDHWTPGGALAAWYGLERLSYCRLDILCPGHGPVVTARAAACVRQAQRRLMAFVRAKGSVCAGERDRWLPTEPLAGGARRILPSLYQFGTNSFLLAGDGGEGFVVDPHAPDIALVEPLMREAGVRTISAATASHYHLDHCDGAHWLRDRFGTETWLHPWVAEPILDRDRLDVPWLPAASIPADRLLPERGRFRWNRYAFESLPFPAQTRWHCALVTEVDGKRLLFSGDNYQPPTRWNGTGGFCSYNGSRFAEGFAQSAKDALILAPELVCNGHRCVYEFHPGHYRKILRWARQAERAVRDLCPSRDWLGDYDCRAISWRPFRSVGKPGDTLRLRIECRNHGRRAVRLAASAVVPLGWGAEPRTARVAAPPHASRGAAFAVKVPRDARPGRYVLAADVLLDGVPIGETAAAIVDVP